MPTPTCRAGLAALWLAACAVPVDVGPDQGGSEVDTDPATPGGAEGLPTTPVAPRRELRGLWIATVWNLDFPSRQDLDAAGARAELEGLADLAVTAGLNALFLQVRPEGDALYASAHEPWSHVLTGTQGADPGFDPLALLVDAARARGLEVHAWLNPFRARAASPAMVAPHLGAVHPEAVVAYGDGHWMDPGRPEVQERLVAVVRDLARSGVEGIHLDDYFYPYPVAGTPFPDAATHAASGSALGLADWRRANVASAVHAVAEAVRAEDPTVRFGISPFGIYRPGQPPGVTGFDAWAGLYADPLAWLAAGDVDYLAPQLYWPTTSSGQPFGALAGWWWAQADGRAWTFVGLDLSRLGSSAAWTREELALQVTTGRAQGATGVVLFRAEHLAMEDRAAWLRAGVFAEPALPPPHHGVDATVRAPEATLEGRTLRLRHRDPVPLRGWAVFGDDGEGWVLERVAQGDALALEPGRWAVAALTRLDTLSAARIVEVD
ncbi:MAG: family 10 glycosylhydrolase [Alphaproteobacteria bacterium]|nr:family 10 glycosylhydrolase [Alphaproteobacteria bacterium]